MSSLLASVAICRLLISGVSYGISGAREKCMETQNTNGDSLAGLGESLRSFADERNWDQFHSPKNLAAALVVESGELLEHFQWISEEESRTLSKEKREGVSEELADVLLYLVRLADKLNVNLIEVAGRKIETNRLKYPVEKSRGSNRKYNEL
jgi:NTP pyrophosphatase (non-canonical NTP hydrolase)